MENESLFNEESPQSGLMDLKDTVEFLNNTSDDEYYSIETIAWKLLVDDENIEKLSSAIRTMSDIADSEENELTFAFEIYMHLFCELVFNIMNINFNSNPENEGKKFYPQYEKNNLEDIVSLLKEKYAKLNLLLYLHSTDITPKCNLTKYIEKNYQDRYSRILLLENVNDKLLLDTYGKYRDKTKFYMMLGSQKFYNTVKSNYKIRDIYSIIVVNKKIYKVYFDFA